MLNLNSEQAMFIYKKLQRAGNGEWPEDSATRLNILMEIEKAFPEDVKQFQGSGIAIVGDYSCI